MSATATATSGQQGPISQKADEPDTLIVGDSTIKDITSKKIKTCYFPDAMVSDINQRLATIILENHKISQVIVHAGLYDIQREQSELLKRDFTVAVDREINRFSCLLALNTLLSRVCNEREGGNIFSE